MSDDTILHIEGLKTRFFTPEGQVNAVNGIDLEITSGEVFGIVGESGSGKSVTALSIVDLIDSPGRVTDGSIWYRDSELADELAESHPHAVSGGRVDLLELPPRVRRALRGTHISMIFQDPLSSFNPTLPVGDQIAEAVEAQQRASSNPRAAATRTQGYGLMKFLGGLVIPSVKYVSKPSRERAVELLEQVGIPDPALRADEYPHEYSGGMLQRAMIAQALAGEPQILIADEPTTALDVTIQAQILDLLTELQQETDMTIVLITHNLGVIARMANRVGVMYAGEIVEQGSLTDVFDDAVHPYTKGLIGSIPDMDQGGTRLEPIPGNVTSLLDQEMGDRCLFADRCPKAMHDCLTKPSAFEVGGGSSHIAKCYLAEMEYDPSQALPEGHFDDQPQVGKVPLATSSDGDGS